MEWRGTVPSMTFKLLTYCSFVDVSVLLDRSRVTELKFAEHQEILHDSEL